MSSKYGPHFRDDALQRAQHIRDLYERRERIRLMREVAWTVAGILIGAFAILGTFYGLVFLSQ